MSMDLHIGQSYWTVIMTVLFFNMTVQYDCPVCEMCLNKPSSSHKNVRPLFIVKIWILGYNGYNGSSSPPPYTPKWLLTMDCWRVGLRRPPLIHSGGGGRTSFSSFTHYHRFPSAGWNFVSEEKFVVYREVNKGLYVVARNVFLLLLNCSAWPCLVPA